MTNNPSPAVAALLSFVFPGAGQLYAGRPLRALVMAVPMLLLIVGFIMVLSGAIDAIGLVTNSQSIAALLVLNIAFFFYHLAAMFDAYLIAQNETGGPHLRASRGAPVALTMLVILTLLVHGSAEAVGIWGRNALADVLPGRSNVIPPASFEPPPTPDITPTPRPTPTNTPAGSPPPNASPTPEVTLPPSFAPIDPNWAPAQDGRLNIILIGADGGAHRSSLRTDTMMLLSVEISTGKAALFGFPRNMVNVPLPAESREAYPGGRFPEMLSALWRRAAEQPNKFVGSEGIGAECQFQWDCARGWRAITGAIQELAGVPVDGVVAVNFYGFIALVDGVGGVWVDVPSRVVDDSYGDPDRGKIKLDIKPGCQRFTGREALAYARSRQQDSDYQRMRRQQIVLRAVRRQFDPIAMIPRINDLLQAAKDNMYTTFSQNDLQNLAIVASRVDADRLYQVRFVPRQVERLGGLDNIKKRVRDIFSEPEPTPTPTPSDRPGDCPPKDE